MKDLKNLKIPFILVSIEDGSYHHNACVSFSLINNIWSLWYVLLYSIACTAMVMLLFSRKSAFWYISFYSNHSDLFLFLFYVRWPFSSSFERTVERFRQRLHQRKLHQGYKFSFIKSQISTCWGQSWSTVFRSSKSIRWPIAMGWRPSS